MKAFHGAAMTVLSADDLILMWKTPATGRADT